MFVLIHRFFESFLADSAHYTSQYKYEKCQPAENIFAGRFIPSAERSPCPHVNLLSYKVLSAYPEEHDAGKQRTYRTDINGTDIHPS